MYSRRLPARGEGVTVELLGLCQGDPYDPHTWSGSSREIFLALRNRGLLRDAVDVEVYGSRRYLNALCECSLDKRAWRENFLKSPRQFTARTCNAAALARRYDPAPDAVLQIGATFDGGAAAPQRPLYCYLDSNCMLSERGGEQSSSYFVKKKYKKSAFACERALYRKAAGIFAFSDFLRDSLIQDFGVDAARVHTVYAGVNMSVPALIPAVQKDPVVLFVGKDFERKGGPLLLRAFAQVRRTLPRARLIIVGTALGIDLPNVEVVDFIDKSTPNGEAQLAALYRRAAVFTMPLHFEPFGIAYAEAMHFGLPCVGGAHNAIPEIVTHNVTGLLVEPGNATALAQALLRLLADPALAGRMGEEGRRKAEQFRWDAVAEKMEAVIQRDLRVNNKESECLRAVS